MHRMDVHHDKDTNSVNVTFDLPGMQKEDVSIDVHNNVLTVSGENRAISERSEAGYVVRERRYGKFTRSLALPQGLKVSTLAMLFTNIQQRGYWWLDAQNEDIKASMANGVLTIKFPKSTPDTEPKKITIVWALT
jgi:HSP20 family protein